MNNGVFKKVSSLFVQPIEDEKECDLVKTNEQISFEPSAPEFTDNLDAAAVISIKDIYENAQLSDESKSIFKIEEIKNILPNTMDSVSKKNSVIGMMGVSNLKVEDVLTDAELRNKVLNTVLSNFTDETINIIQNGENEITNLKDQITNLEKMMEERKQMQTSQEKVINDEITKINNIVNFIK